MLGMVGFEGPQPPDNIIDARAYCFLLMLLDIVVLLLHLLVPTTFGYGCPSHWKRVGMSVYDWNCGI